MDRGTGIRAQNNPTSCPRIDGARTVEDHLACRYCFGTAAEVATGRRPAFCNYEPGVDPICFGFPETSSRLLRG